MNNTSLIPYIGLTKAEVLKRTSQSQTNYVEKFTTRTISGILRNNIFTVFNGILLAAVVSLLLVKANVDALFLSTVTVINVLVGLIEEIRAKITLDKLTLLHRRTAKVIRDHTEQIIPIEEVVKDDVIVITSGEQVIADGLLISQSPIYMDESLVTGESDIIKKNINDNLLSGTICTNGFGYYKATKVGSLAHINTIIAQAKNYKITRTPIQKDIDKLVEILTLIMIIIVILLAGLSFIKNLSLKHSVLAIVTVIKSLVPQGLVLISTLAFALGAIRAAKKQVLAQKLNAIEAMSHLTTLCLDKTGTICTNVLKFEKLELLSSTLDEIVYKLKLFVGAVKDKNKTIQAIAQNFIELPSKIIAELPFASAHKMSAVQVKYQNKEYSLWLGAPEILTTNPFSKDEITLLNQLRHSGFRVLLFASSTEPITSKIALTNLAFVVLRDELRPKVAEAIKFYENRNVNLKILSGDHPETIAALANQAGIIQNGELINGKNLIGLSEQDFEKTINNGQFFGGLIPQQKKLIIKALQKKQEFVGMIGDGVNDVLALKQADIGIAMNSGAAAAKDVADITLLQNDFTHLPFLSQEGDRIIYNIKRIAKLFITKNIYCLLYMILALSIGLEFPLTPRYITWIDMLTIGIPVTILTLIITDIPKQSAKGFLSEAIKFSLISGFVIAVMALSIYSYYFWQQQETILSAKTAGISTIIVMGWYVVFFATITANKKLPITQQRYLLYVVWRIIIICGLLFLCGMHLSFFRSLLDITHLTYKMLFVIFAFSALGMFFVNLLLKCKSKANF